jgi:hypothetical protein
LATIISPGGFGCAYEKLPAWCGWGDTSLWFLGRNPAAIFLTNAPLCQLEQTRIEINSAAVTFMLPFLDFGFLVGSCKSFVFLVSREGIEPSTY